MVKNVPYNARDVGLISGRGTKIPHATKWACVLQRESLCTSKKDRAWCQKILCVATKTLCSQIKSNSDCSQLLSTCYELGILSKLWEIVEDRGAWQAIVHGVAKGWTWHSDWTTTTDFWPLTHLTFTSPWQANQCDGSKEMRKVRFKNSSSLPKATKIITSWVGSYTKLAQKAVLHLLNCAVSAIFQNSRETWNI